MGVGTLVTLEPFFLYRKDRSWRSGKLKTACREAGIAVATFKNQAVNVRIPFEIPAKSMKNHDITESEVFGFVHFKEHVGNNTATEWKRQ